MTSVTVIVNCTSAPALATTASSVIFVMVTTVAPIGNLVAEVTSAAGLPPAPSRSAS